MEIKFVGVIGAGVMGKGLSQCLAQSSYQVLLIDVSEEVLKNSEKEIRNNIRVQNLFRKHADTANMDEIMNRIIFSADYNLLSGVDYVIENVTEDLDIKKHVYLKIDELCPVHCIFAANTSAIPIGKLASWTKRPSKVIGMHFMNPVPLIPAVEVIRAESTSDETLEASKRLLAAMKKESIVVKDSPGFVLNRILMLAINEAVYLLEEKTASALDIDTLFRKCPGHKMGPLETADLIGLDTVLRTLEILYDSFGNKFSPAPELKKMVAAGLYGRKSGKGFYDYTQNR